MNRFFLNVGEASSKIVLQPGSRQVDMTAVTVIRGSYAAKIVQRTNQS